MAGNAGLSNANKAKKDEFYTQLSDIELELKHYKKHFRGKTVFCNCDDPYESNFFKYFALRFNLLYGGYDYCVIQQAAHPYPPVESTLDIGGEIIDLCHRCGVTPVVYMTWAEKRFPAHQ